VSKDLFEIRIKEQLSGMKAPVPEGAWAAIKAQIPSAGAASAGAGSVSSVNFGVGIAAGAVLLSSLGVYSELKDAGQAEKSPSTNVLLEKSRVDDSVNESTPETIDFEEARAIGQKNKEQADQNSEVAIQENQIAESVDITAESELSSDGDANEAVVSTPVTPIAKKDSNGLSTEVTSESAENRSPVTAGNSQPIAEEKTIKAEIMASELEGYAPFSVKLYNAGSGAENIWEVNGRTLKGSIVEATFEEPGDYSVYLTTYNEAGSIQSEDEIQIVVKAGSEIKLPNIFTPNGDGLNDTYKIGYAKNIKDFFIQISDETGRVVYTSTDITEEWEYDQNQGTDNRRYLVQYQAIGKDGKVHADQFPLIIVTD